VSETLDLRALDGEIAVLLGWTARKHKSHRGSGNYLWEVSDHTGKVREIDIIVESGDTPEKIVRQFAPYYTTDNNAALGLFEPQFGIDIYVHSATEYQVRVYERFKHNNSDEIHAETLPLALCRAWLSFVASHGGTAQRASGDGT